MCTGVTVSYVSDILFDLDIRISPPIDHRHTVPRPSYPCAQCRAPYDDSVEFQSFSDTAVSHTTPRGLSSAVSPYTFVSYFLFLLTSARRVLSSISSRSAYKYPRVWLREEPGNCSPTFSLFSVCFDCASTCEPAVPQPSFWSSVFAFHLSPPPSLSLS